MKITKSALYGEFLGTYAMVFCGTAAMAVNELNGSISHVGVAITWGLIVMAMIYAFGELSGAHFNPAVTVGFALSGRFAWRNVPMYIVMQVIAATLASITVKYLLPESEFIGASIPSIDATRAFVLETILTFILMIVIIHISTGSKEIGPVAGLAVGSVILLEAMFAGPLTNASMNPARSLGPALVSGHIQSLWIYLTAPFLGASLAVIIAKRF
jgi:aquaporin Z